MCAAGSQQTVALMNNLCQLNNLEMLRSTHKRVAIRFMFNLWNRKGNNNRTISSRLNFEFRACQNKPPPFAKHILVFREALQILAQLLQMLAQLLPEAHVNPREVRAKSAICRFFASEGQVTEPVIGIHSATESVEDSRNIATGGKPKAIVQLVVEQLATTLHFQGANKGQIIKGA